MPDGPARGPRGRVGRPAAGPGRRPRRHPPGARLRWPGGRATTKPPSSTLTCCSWRTRRCSARRASAIFDEGRAPPAPGRTRWRRRPRRGRRWTTRTCARGPPTCAASASRSCVACSARPPTRRRARRRRPALAPASSWRPTSRRRRSPAWTPRSCGGGLRVRRPHLARRDPGPLARHPRRRGAAARPCSAWPRGRCSCSTARPGRSPSTRRPPRCGRPRTAGAPGARRGRGRAARLTCRP